MPVMGLDGAAPDDVQRLVVVADLEDHRIRAPVDGFDGGRRTTPQHWLEQIEWRRFFEEFFDVSQRIAHGRQS